MYVSFSIRITDSDFSENVKYFVHVHFVLL